MTGLQLSIPNAPRWLVLRVNSTAWELAMLGVFVVYVFLVFVELALFNREVVDTINNKQVHSALVRAFLWVDLFVMLFFFVEICIQVWIKGRSYIRSTLNLVDITAVLAFIVLTIISICVIRDDGEKALSEVPVLQVVKVARLLRLVLVMVRLQQSSERHYRFGMMGVGAPVEKVFDILLEFRERPDVLPEDKITLGWTMELIAKAEIYSGKDVCSTSIDMGQSHVGMAEWFRTHLRVCTSNSTLGPEGTRSLGNNYGDSASFVQNTPDDWIVRSLSQASVSAALENVISYEFDVFAFSQITNMHSLVVGGIHLMQRMHVLREIPVPFDRLSNYLFAIEQGYLQGNPFHNVLHASDVMFTTFCLLQSEFLKEITGSLDRFTAVLAAAVHDLGHPALNNAFLVATRSPEAILYNDSSVLEMFHISGAFRIMHTTPGCDISEFMSREQYRQFRETMISMVLATDLKYHFEHLGRLKTRNATDAYARVDRKDVLLLLGLVVHSADISNPTKHRELMLEWTKRVMAEFFLQGDRERDLGIPISAFMDRKQPAVSQCQIGFINVLVKPLFVEMRKLLGDVAQPAIEYLESNLTLWQTEGSSPAAGWDLEAAVWTSVKQMRAQP